MNENEMVEKITQTLGDKGLLVEAGWVGFRMKVVPANASEVQLREMRLAFFAGAQHLFSSIMVMLDPGVEPSEKDLERMSKIHKELGDFVKEFMG